MISSLPKFMTITIYWVKEIPFHLEISYTVPTFTHLAMEKVKCPKPHTNSNLLKILCFMVKN